MNETIKAIDAKFGRYYECQETRIRCEAEGTATFQPTFRSNLFRFIKLDVDEITELPAECDSFDWQPSKETDTGPCRKYLKRVILARDAEVGHEYETAYGRVMAFRPRSNTGRDYINRDGIVLGFHRDSHFVELHDSPPIDDIPDESWDAMQEHVASTEELPSTSEQPPITLGSVWEIEKKEYQVRFETSGFVLRSVKSGSACSWGAHESNIEKLAKVIADDSMKFIRQDAITPDVVDVGEGWKLVPFSEGCSDSEALDLSTGKWFQSSSFGASKENGRVYRRRIKPAHNLKAGDWVRLKDGSLDEITSIHGEFIALQNEHSHAVKCVTKVKFRRFASAAEFAPYRRDYVMFPDALLTHPLGQYGDATVAISGCWYSYADLLEEYKLTFENGQPFGIAEDVK